MFYQKIRQCSPLDPSEMLWIELDSGVCRPITLDEYIYPVTPTHSGRSDSDIGILLARSQQVRGMMMNTRTTNSPQSPQSRVLMRVWSWFVYDAVEADAMCLCACHLGAVRHSTACICAPCPSCRLRIQAARMSEHRCQCREAEKGGRQNAVETPRAA